MKPLKRLVLVTTAIVGLNLVAPAQSQAQSTEERFQDLFTTAGYATAFGAALGAAALGLTRDPENHLRYVAVGASLGFIGGSLLGSYIVFSPAVVDSKPGAQDDGMMALASMPSRGLVVRPTYDRTERRVTTLEGGLTLVNF